MTDKPAAVEDDSQQIPNGRGTDSDTAAASDSTTDTVSEAKSNTTSATETESTTTDTEERNPPRYHPPRQEKFDWRGWILIAIIVISFLVVPGAILYLPHAQGVISAVGLSWRQAYLALPMIPAILLGATAIWSAVSSRSNKK